MKNKDGGKGDGVCVGGGGELNREGSLIEDLRS